MPSKRLLLQAKEMGWTHRQKRKSRDAYLKIQSGPTEPKPKNGKRGPRGATYVDMDQKFRWLADKDVIEL